MRGILLAGGKGTRLLPITRSQNKHMVGVLNIPLILYPINTLKTLGVTNILIVTGGDHLGSIAEFLEDGSDYGVSLQYAVQKEAGGIGQALGLAKDFAQNESIVVILADNVYENKKLPYIPPIRESDNAAWLFVKRVPDPERFGVIEFGNKGEILRIEEKPKKPKSNFAVTGLYIYPPDVFDVIKTLVPSGRGEIEITDVNNFYIKNNRCGAYRFPGFWSDSGTRKSLKNVIDWAYKNETN